MTEVLVREAEARAYLDQVDEDLLCVAVEQVTHDVVSLTLALPEGAALDFSPGQYVTVTTVVKGEPLSRCYTIASSPLQLGTITLTVKRQGPVSTWLHDRLGVGGRLRVSGPMGVFSTREHPAAAHLLLSAGSGITPLMSMLRTLAADGAGDVVFVHSARTPADIIFRRELEELEAALPWLRVAVVCEGDSEDEVWRGPRGRLSAGLLAELVPDAAAREVFTCGPGPYMDGVRALLPGLGCDPARCHEESFVLDTSGAVVGGVAAATGGGEGVAEATGGGESLAAEMSTHTVTLTRSGREVPCAAGQTILAAAAQAGLSLPSSCAEGVCGTCKSQLLRGSVDMRHGGGIRPREIAADKVLLCCSTPLEDCVIEA